MNQSLTALMTKLNWQKNELSLQLKKVEKESQTLVEELAELNKRLNLSSTQSLTINPEFEINRLNFITQEQLKKDELHTLLKNNQTQESTLKDKMQRINTESKMLENYLAKEQQQLNMHQQKMSEHNLEEWVLHQRESA